MSTATDRINPYRTAMSFFRSLAGRDESTTDPFVHRSGAEHAEVPIAALHALRS